MLSSVFLPPFCLIDSFQQNSNTDLRMGSLPADFWRSIALNLDLDDVMTLRYCCRGLRDLFSANKNELWFLLFKESCEMSPEVHEHWPMERSDPWDHDVHDRPLVPHVEQMIFHDGDSDFKFGDDTRSTMMVEDPQDYVENWAYDANVDWFKEAAHDVALHNAKLLFEQLSGNDDRNCKCVDHVEIQGTGEISFLLEDDDDEDGSNPKLFDGKVENFEGDFLREIILIAGNEDDLLALITAAIVARIGHSETCWESEKMQEAWLANPLAFYPAEAMLEQLRNAKAEDTFGTAIKCVCNRLNALELEQLADLLIDENRDKWEMCSKMIHCSSLFFRDADDYPGAVSNFTYRDTFFLGGNDQEKILDDYVEDDVLWHEGLHKLQARAGTKTIFPETCDEALVALRAFVKDVIEGGDPVAGEEEFTLEHLDRGLAAVYQRQVDRVAQHHYPLFSEAFLLDSIEGEAEYEYEEDEEKDEEEEYNLDAEEWELSGDGIGIEDWSQLVESGRLTQLVHRDCGLVEENDGNYPGQGFQLPENGKRLFVYHSGEDSFSSRDSDDLVKCYGDDAWGNYPKEWCAIFEDQHRVYFGEPCIPLL